MIVTVPHASGAVISLVRVDGWLVEGFQHAYEATWDRVAVPIGSFRMAVAVTPVCIDTGLEFSQGWREQNVAGVVLYIIAFCLLYSPVRMMRDNRLQLRGALATLNVEARTWVRRSSSLRRFYIVLTVFTLLAFHHLGGLALLGIAYARCIQVRPRVPTRRVLEGWRIAIVSS